MPSKIQALTTFGFVALILALLVTNIPAQGKAPGLSLLTVSVPTGTPMWQLSISDGILFMAMASFFFDLLIYFKEKK